MMRRRDLLSRLKRIAKDRDVDYKVTVGGRHTRVDIGGNSTYVPRHSEIGDMLAKQIIKQAQGKDTK